MDDGCDFYLVTAAGSCDLVLLSGSLDVDLYHMSIMLYSLGSLVLLIITHLVRKHN
jgi:hypothetical protein